MARGIAMICFNELREGQLRANEVNALVGALNHVAANLRFEKQQQRKAEDAEMLRQVEDLIAANTRLRQVLVDRGIIPPGDVVIVEPTGL
jgi:hypothetical protein